MTEIAHFVQFLSFSLGLVAIYIVFIQLNQMRDKVLRQYTIFLTGAFLVVFLHVLEAFLKLILSDAVYDQHFRNLFLILIIPLGALRLYMAWLFLDLCHSLLNRKLNRAFAFMAAGVYILFVAFVFITEMETNTRNIAEGIAINTIHLLLSASIFYGSLLVLRNKEGIQLIKPEMIKPVFIFFIAYSIIRLFIRLLNFPPNRMDEDVLMFCLGVLALVFFLMNALMLKRVFVKSGESSLLIDGSLFDSYGISKREKEIIALICQGKTNKQIGEELFISPLTVRDHTSNIFKKTGVSSRAQLAGLFTAFMETPSPSSSDK